MKLRSKGVTLHQVGYGLLVSQSFQNREHDSMILAQVGLECSSPPQRRAAG